MRYQSEQKDPFQLEKGGGKKQKEMERGEKKFVRFVCFFLAVAGGISLQSANFPGKRGRRETGSLCALCVNLDKNTRGSKESTTTLNYSAV